MIVIKEENEIIEFATFILKQYKNEPICLPQKDIDAIILIKNNPKTFLIKLFDSYKYINKIKLSIIVIENDMGAMITRVYLNNHDVIKYFREIKLSYLINV